MVSKTIQVGLIDDGVNEGFIYKCELKNNIEITPELKIISRANYNTCEPSHGTICAAIIKHYSSEASLNSIKILDDTKTCNVKQLIKAIEWCIYNNIQLINISLGTVDYRDFFSVKRVVNKAFKKGIIIVAACNNDNIVTYPASLFNVIGVKCDTSNNLSEGEYIFRPYSPDGIEIVAYGNNFITLFTGEPKKVNPSNSYATPLITSKIYNIMKNNHGISFDNIKSLLKIGAKSSRNLRNKADQYHSTSINWIQSALLFEINKYDLNTKNIGYSFEVIKSIDFKCTNLNNGFEKIMDFIKKNYRLLYEIDTVIIIIYGKLEKSSLVIYQIIKYFDTIKKNFVYIDDNLNNIKKISYKTNNNIKIWLPSVYNNIYSIVNEKKVDYNIPLIIIYDFTENKLLNFLKNLYYLFANNGHYAVISTTTSLGVLADYQYIPLTKHIGNVEHRLNLLRSIYPADVIIYGIDKTKTSYSNIKLIEKHFEIDLRIFLFDEFNSSYRAISTIASDKKIKETIISVPKNNGFSRLIKTKTFYYNKEIPVTEMFKYIMYLFES